MFRRQNFDCHFVLECRMLCQINAAHAARAQKSKEFIFVKNKSFVLPFSQFVDLPRSQKFFFDEMLEQFLGNWSMPICPRHNRTCK